MATSGQLSKVNSSYSARATLSWEVVNTYADTNKSRVYWILEIQSISKAHYVEYDTSVRVKVDEMTATGMLYARTYDIGTHGIIDGYTTISHGEGDEKTFDLSFYISGDYSEFGEITTSGTGVLDEIDAGAKLISAYSFTDEENPVITYKNPAKESATTLQACISYDGYDVTDVPYRDIPKDWGVYTFELTEEERAALRARVTTGSSVTVKFYIKAVVRGKTYLHSLTRVFTIVNPEPLLNPVVGDIYDKTKALTGDGFSIIKYHSIVAYNMGAEAVKGASIASQTMINGSNTYTAASGILEEVENGIFDFAVTDSRGLYTQKTVTLNVVPYIPLTANLKINSFTAVGEMKFTITGKYYEGSFGAKDNSMRLEVELLDEGGSTISSLDLGPVTPTVNDLGNYTYSHTLTGLDYQRNYTVHVTVTDELTPAISISTIAAPIPTFDWGKEDFNFNVPVYIQGEPIADFIVETGQEAMGSNGIWHWAKWSSGKAECYGCRNYGNTGVSNTWGSLYRSEIFTQALPSGLFASVPDVINISLAQGSYGGWIVTHEQSAPTENSTGSFMIVRPANATISQAYISFNVIGRWK